MKAARSSGAALAALSSLPVLIAACGARTGLDYPPPLPPPPECFVDADCPGAEDLCAPVTCVLYASEGTGGGGGSGGSGGSGGASGGTLTPTKGGHCEPLPVVDCDDKDPCTNDVCEPSTGVCHYSVATLDSDGDGYRAARAGTLPGQPGSCGDDCDDTSPLAHPGGIEVCDGVDNDCNGIVDDNAGFIPSPAPPVRISGDIDPAGPGGLAFNGTTYAATYTGTTQGTNVYLSMLTPEGDKVVPPGEAPITLVNADASGGPAVWVGDRFGVAWQDRRNGDYEIYFTLLDPAGKKSLADTQLTYAPGFSVNPSMAWNGTEFLVVWQDVRDGIFNLMAQRVDVGGAPVGSNIKLTDAQNFGSESPSVAVGKESVGVASFLGDPSTSWIQFQVFSTDLSKPITPPVTVTDGLTNPKNPTVVWANDRYLIAWQDETANPKAIYAAAVAEDGTILVPPKPVSSPGSQRSRYPNLRSLGDRALLVYSDNRDLAPNGYQLYTRMVTKELGFIGPERRVTNGPNNDLYPIAAFGPEGTVGILYRADDASAGLEHHVWFTRLECVAGASP